MGRGVVQNISQLSYQRHQPIKMDTGPVRMYTGCKELALVLTCSAQVSALLVGECNTVSEYLPCARLWGCIIDIEAVIRV